MRNNTAEEKESIITDQQLEIDYDIENKMIKERSEMINDVEQATVRIHGIMNDLGVMVEEQGDNLEIISDELMKTNRNMVVANENIEEASKLQSKSRKKYLIFLLIIIIVIAAVVGFVFIFV